jgi:hypothetical protein
LDLVWDLRWVSGLSFASCCSKKHRGLLISASSTAYTIRYMCLWLLHGKAWQERDLLIKGEKLKIPALMCHWHDWKSIFAAFYLLFCFSTGINVESVYEVRLSIVVW